MRPQNRLFLFFKAALALAFGLLGANVFGQGLPESPLLIFDRFGTTFTIEEVCQPAEKGAGASALCFGGDFECATGGSFDVVFDFEEDPALMDWFFENEMDDGTDDTGKELGDARKDVLCEVMTYLAGIFETPSASPTCAGCDKPTLLIRVNQSFTDPDDTLLGAASPLFYALGDSKTDNWVAYGSPWRLVNGGTDPHEYPYLTAGFQPYHGAVKFNFGHEYHYNSATSPASNEHDFYTIVLHEFLHIFGFLSLIQENGTGGIWGGDIYSKYDMYLKTQADVDVMNESDVCDIGYNTAVTSSDLSNGTCSHIGFESPAFGSPLPVFAGDADNDFIPGSSLSHINSDCYAPADFVMHPSLATGVTRRTITNEELHILCDIGYNISISGVTCDNTVVGVDDPCDGSFYEIANPCDGTISLDWSVLLGNDINAVDFLCDVRVEQGGGEIIDVGSTVGDPLIFDAQGNMGWHILSYHPTDATGTEVGNRAFIFIKSALCESLFCTTPPECSLICNPDLHFPVFTDFRYQVFSTPDMQTSGWGCLHGKPDYEPDTPDGNGAVVLTGVGTSCLSYDPLFLSEMIWTNAIIEANASYFLSYIRKAEDATSITNFSIYGSNLETLLTLPLSTGFAVDDCMDGDNNFVASFSDATGTYCHPCFPTNRELLSQELFDGSATIPWTKFTTRFEANQDWNVVFVRPNHTDDGIIETFQLFLEQFELIKDVQITQTEWNVLCGTPITIGDEFFCASSNPDAPHGMEDLTLRWQVSTDEGLTWNDIVGENSGSLTVTPDQLTTHYKIIREFVVDGSEYYTLAGDNYFEDVIEVNVTDGCCFDNSFDITDPHTVSGTPPTTWVDGANGLDNLSGTIRMNADIVVPFDMDLTISNMSIQFGPMGRIIVEQGGKLTLDNCMFTGDLICGTMWQGIQVHGFGILFPQDDVSGQVTLNGTTIQNAIIGIATWQIPLIDFEDIALIDQADFNTQTNVSALLMEDYLGYGIQPAITGGGRYNVGVSTTGEKSQFINCFHGINDSYYRYTANANTLTGTNFVSNTDLLYPFDHLELPTEAGVFELYLNIPADIDDCTFTGVKYGVRANEVISQDITNCVFTDCTVGVSSRNMNYNTDQSFTISQNDFELCNIAIQCDANIAIIEENEINLNTTLADYPAGEMALGLYLRGTDLMVSNNIIKEVNMGIVLTDNDEEGSILGGNEVWNAEIAVLAEGNNLGAQLRCNHLIDYTASGIELRHWADAVGDVGNGDLGQQGDCDLNKPAANTFLPIGSAFAVYFGTNTNDLIYHDVDAGSLGTAIGMGASPTGIYDFDNCPVPDEGLSLYCNNLGFTAFTDIELMGGEIEKNKELAKWLFEYQKTGDKTAALALLNDFDTKMTKRKLVAEHIYQASYTNAQSLLDDLTETSEEEIRFKEYHQLLIDLGQNGQSIFEINAAQETQLTDIANSKTKTAYRAQTALYLAKGIETPINLPTTSTANGNSWFTVFKQGQNNGQFSPIYPNPVTQTAAFDYHLDEDQSIELKVYNTTGVIVASNTLKGTGRYDINVAHYPAGLYLCIFSNKEGMLHKEQFIVNK